MRARPERIHGARGLVAVMADVVPLDRGTGGLVASVQGRIGEAGIRERKKRRSTWAPRTASETARISSDAAHVSVEICVDSDQLSNFAKFPIIDVYARTRA